MKLKFNAFADNTLVFKKKRERQRKKRILFPMKKSNLNFYARMHKEDCNAEKKIVDLLLFLMLLIVR
jgi:hypothetical protein